ncbi:MAG: demethylmenaquinone methyltransferase/2-methoxy-6-polyprenyl-1,4-benzoquinol methylase [Bradymonadia bacterium]|jgi:demethylmenaquinone methyltransferase/2-methoxy-6-polyprenyl-1,4-benzoquinol methylase
MRPQDVPALPANDKRDYVRGMFDALAPRYDRMNLVISLGQTTWWRKRALRGLGLQAGQRVLDIGTGTGWVVTYLKGKVPGLVVDGSDLSPGMLVEARKLDPDSHYFEADVCELPCETGSYDMVTTVFTTRNFPTLEPGVSEMMRVLKPGGRLLVLDSFPFPEGSLWGRFQALWMSKIVPILVKPFANPDSYRYLAASIQNHVSPEELSELCKKHGATTVDVTPYTFGSATKVLATKAQ